MDKKQFFESFIFSRSDDSGQELRARDRIARVLDALKSDITDDKLKIEFERLEREILFRVWMFEQVCNSRETGNKDEGVLTPGPLIVIFLWKDLLFTNKIYCELSGLTLSEMQDKAKNGTLYDEVYEWVDLSDAKEAISRLRAGKWYKELELTMRHSWEKVAWNSYGWVGGALEIRSGRMITRENSQKKERELHYRGSLMNTTRLIDNIYQVCIHGILSEENEIQLVWIRELLSMFDFLWNHSEFFMEIVDLPESRKEKIYGAYNTVYSQFFGRSFQEGKTFKEVLTSGYHMTMSEWIALRMEADTPHIQILPFYNCSKKHRADVDWQSSPYPYVITKGYTKIFSFGTVIRTVRHRGIFHYILEIFFRKKPRHL